MKQLLKLCLVFTLFFLASSCNLSKTAVVRDTVKELTTTTADFYDFYSAEIGEGQLKDYNYTISKNKHNQDLVIVMVPATSKQDLGYFIVKPAGSEASATTLSPDIPAQHEIKVRLGDFSPVMIPQRGN